MCHTPVNEKHAGISGCYSIKNHQLRASRCSRIAVATLCGTAVALTCRFCLELWNTYGDPQEGDITQPFVVKIKHDKTTSK